MLKFLEIFGSFGNFRLWNKGMLNLLETISLEFKWIKSSTRWASQSAATDHISGTQVETFRRKSFTVIRTDCDDYAGSSKEIVCVFEGCFWWVYAPPRAEPVLFRCDMAGQTEFWSILFPSRAQWEKWKHFKLQIYKLKNSFWAKLRAFPKFFTSIP